MKTKSLVLEIIHLVISLTYALFTAIACLFLIFLGIGLSFFDVIGQLFNGIDGSYTENTYSIFFVIASILLLLTAVLILPAAIASILSAAHEHFETCKFLYIATCIFFGLSIFFELIICVWLHSANNAYSLDSFFEWKHFIWPVISIIFFVAILALTFFNLKVLKKEDNELY